MELKDFLTSVKRQRITVVSFIILFFILAIIASLAQPMRYSAESKLLIIQENTALDAYTLAKSNDYLGGLLSRVVASNSFYNKIVESDYKIDRNYFGKDNSDQIKNWNKAVVAKGYNDSGIIAINIYHRDKAQAEQLAKAVNYVLMTEHGAYHGLGDKVKIKLIDQPMISKYPVKPNLILNFALALILGSVFGLAYIYLLPEREYGFNIFSIFKRRHKKNKINESLMSQVMTDKNNSNFNNHYNKSEVPVAKVDTESVIKQGDINNLWR